MERFFKTVEEGDEGEVAKWLDANPRLLEETNDEGNRPLAMAASRGHLGVVTLLFQRGANVDAANLTGKTALHRAASKGQEGVVTFLLRQGAQANSRNDVGKTPLILASVKGSVGVVRVLLQHVGGEALQETDDKGRTALHWVAYRGHEAVATLLLDQGAKATSRGASGETPFMLACQEGHLAVVGLFLRHVGANIGGQALHHTDDKGTTPLHLAALRGHAELVAFLLGQGAQANSRDILGKTPLLYGCKSGHLGAVRVLALHMGEDGLKEKYAQGRTVLHYAARAGHEDVAALLVGLGAQANSRDAISKTPLMWACEKGHLGVVRMLAQHMGEEGLNEQDANGRTVLHWAVEKGRDEAVKILLLAGADPTITDTEGRTPRALAEGEVERAGCLAAFEVCKSRVLYPHSDISLSVLTSRQPHEGVRAIYRDALSDQDPT
jgi:ankyrin repeat protein